MPPTVTTPRHEAIEQHEPVVHDWPDRAACLHADPDLFFPVSATGPALRQIEQAKRICRAWHRAW